MGEWYHLVETAELLPEYNNYVMIVVMLDNIILIAPNRSRRANIITLKL